MRWTRRQRVVLCLGVAALVGLTGWSWWHGRSAENSRGTAGPEVLVAPKGSDPKGSAGTPRVTTPIAPAPVHTIAGVPLMAVPWKQSLDQPTPVKLATAPIPFRPNRTAPSPLASNSNAASPTATKDGVPLLGVPWKQTLDKPVPVALAIADLSSLKTPPASTTSALATIPVFLLPVEMPKAKEQLFVRSLAEDLQHRVWVGTEDDGVWCYDDGAPQGQQWKQFTTKDGLGDDNAYAVMCDRLGRIWIGHLNHGVSVYNGQKWQNYDVLDGPLGERVFALATSPVDGDVWIATSAGITRYSLKNDNWTHYTRGDGLPSDQANSLAFAADGTLYVGTQCDGIAIGHAQDSYQSWRVVQGSDKLPLVPKGEGLPTSLINQVLVMRDGTVYAATTTGLAWSKDQGRSWAFTRGLDWADKVRGLYGGPPTGWQPTGEPELLEDYLTSLAEDEVGNLWVGTRRRGLQVLERPAHRGKNAVPRYASASYVTAILVRPGGIALLGLYPGEILQAQTGAGTGMARLVGSPTVSRPALPSAAKPPTLEELNQALARLSKIEVLPSGRQPKVVALEDDWRTRGAWLGRYGRYWICLAATVAPGDFVWGPGAMNVSYTACMGPHHDQGDSLRYWIQWNHTSNPGSLELPMPYLHSRVEKKLTTWDVDRRHSEWDDHGEAYKPTMEGPDIYCNLRIPAGRFILSLYEMNKDGHEGPNRERDYRVSIREHVSGKILSSIEGFAQQPELAHSRLRDFWGGVYKRFLISGPIDLVIKVDRNYSYNSNLAGVMLDLLDECPPPYFQQGRETSGRSADASSSFPDAERLALGLELLKGAHPTQYASESRRMYNILARACATSDRDGPVSSADHLALWTCSQYHLGLFAQWEVGQKSLGLVPAREIEKALRWDGRANSSPRENEELVEAYHKQRTAPATRPSSGVPSPQAPATPVLP